MAVTFHLVGFAMQLFSLFCSWRRVQRVGGGPTFWSSRCQQAISLSWMKLDVQHRDFPTLILPYVWFVVCGRSMSTSQEKLRIEFSS